jgi:hypothetical protein
VSDNPPSKDGGFFIAGSFRATQRRTPLHPFAKSIPSAWITSCIG